MVSRAFIWFEIINFQFPLFPGSKRIWNAWSDASEEGVFSDVYTSEKMPEDLGDYFAPGEPNGGISENCLISRFEAEGGQAFRMSDVSCTDKFPAYCFLPKVPQLKMRGNFLTLQSGNLLKLCILKDSMKILTFCTVLIQCICKLASLSSMDLLTHSYFWTRNCKSGKLSELPTKMSMHWRIQLTHR